MGAMQRAKGARGEREVVEVARVSGFPHARRFLAGDGLQPGDLDRGPDGWVLEVKWWDDVTAATRVGVAQAERERVAAGREHCAAAIRLPRRRWLAVMHVDQWIACDAFGAIDHVVHDGTVPTRLAVAHSRGGLSDIGRGLLALPLEQWFAALAADRDLKGI